MACSPAAQVTRGSDLNLHELSPQERATIDAIVEARWGSGAAQLQHWCRAACCVTCVGAACYVTCCDLVLPVGLCVLPMCCGHHHVVVLLWC
jgi:hypothetical protein